MFPNARRMSDKYRHACRGLWVAVRDDDSFRVHLLAAAVVLAAAVWLRVSMVEGILLGLCVAAVMAAELFNTAIEHLARAVIREQHPGVRDCLDIAAAAVMVVALAAKVVGSVIFAMRLLAG